MSTTSSIEKSDKTRMRFIQILSTIRLKQHVIIGILMIFCFAEIRPILPFLDYYVNYEYISEVECVNKDEPKSTCKGKCYLNQQIQNSQESEKNDEKLPTVEQKRMPMLICNNGFPNRVTKNSTVKKRNAFYQFSIKDLSITPPTPPPKC